MHIFPIQSLKECSKVFCKDAEQNNSNNFARLPCVFWKEILSFENVIFDDLITWLEALEQHYSIGISEVDVNVTDRTSGLCNARITLVENS